MEIPATTPEVGRIDAEAARTRLIIGVCAEPVKPETTLPYLDWTDQPSYRLTPKSSKIGIPLTLYFYFRESLRTANTQKP